MAAWRAADEYAYLAWARRVVGIIKANQQCRSRRCRRIGCQSIFKCEPQQRADLHSLLATLAVAELEDGSIRKETRAEPAAGQRRAMLAASRRQGLLPLPRSGGM